MMPNTSTHVRMFRSSLGRVFEHVFEHVFEQDADIRYRAILEALGDRSNQEAFGLLRSAYGMNYDAEGAERLRELLVAWEASGYREDAKSVVQWRTNSSDPAYIVRHLGLLDALYADWQSKREAWRNGDAATYLEAVLAGVAPEYAAEMVGT